MFKIKRNGRTSLIVAVMVTLAMFFAACTSFQWLTPVPSTETPVAVAEATDAESAPETPDTTVVTPTVEATPEVTPEAVAETEGADEEAAEAAEEAGEQGALPSPITHRLERHEECRECHAVDSSRHSSPADHVNYSDDLCLYCHLPEEGEAAVPPLPDPVTTEFCLTCHGNFEALMERTAGYVTDDGEAVNPHMYIPHNRTDIRPCVKCHELHPLPVIAPEDIPVANVEYCYTACHHEENFRACDDCHDEDE